MPNSENGTSGLECKCNTQFFVPSTEFFPEDVELQFWKGSPLFPLETVFSWGCRYHSRKERMEPLSNGIPSSLMGISPKFPISNFQFPKVAYHLLKVSGEKSGRKVNDTCLFGSFRQKISGSNGTHLIKLDKVVLFFRMESSKRKLVFHFFKAMFDKNFRPSRLFLGKWNQFVQM